MYPYHVQIDSTSYPPELGLSIKRSLHHLYFRNFFEYKHQNRQNPALRLKIIP